MLGVSDPYSSDIWGGKIPHPRHWQALTQLASVSSDAKKQALMLSGHYGNPAISKAR